MYQYTTPSITISIPESLLVTSIDKMVVTLKQGDIKLEKTEEQVSYDTANNSVFFSLTQEETGMFKAGTVYVQCHILVGDTAYATQIMKANIFRNIHGEVIV